MIGAEVPTQSRCGAKGGNFWVDESRILVLDDDGELRGLLERYLGAQGVHVRTLGSAQMLDRLLEREPWDLLVLDLSMPGEDGLSVCRRLRARGEFIPILMLTARGEPIDRILGLEMGADDYLAKPFEPRELLARIRAILRRRTLRTGADGSIVAFGDWRFDLESGRLHRDSEEVELRLGEYALLRALVSHPNQPMGRERLLELAKGRDVGMTLRSIDVQVLRLRRVLEDEPSSPRRIRTVWGVGYMFVPDRVREPK
jgi:two-component system, OmpR family, phosphate regulon response regulator OmpR